MREQANISKPRLETESEIQLVDMEIAEGESIVFTPTGEQWRITSVDDGKIIFERIP